MNGCQGRPTPPILFCFFTLPLLTSTSTHTKRTKMKTLLSMSTITSYKHIISKTQKKPSKKMKLIPVSVVKLCSTVFFLVLPACHRNLLWLCNQRRGAACCVSRLCASLLGCELVPFCRQIIRLCVLWTMRETPPPLLLYSAHPLCASECCDISDTPWKLCPDPYTHTLTAPGRHQNLPKLWCDGFFFLNG